MIGKPEFTICALVLMAALVGGYYSPFAAQVRDRPQALGPERDQQAAEIAIFVFRATATGGNLTRSVSIAPSVDHVSSHAAARALMALEKPVQCDAGVEQTVLHVSCQPINNTQALDWERQSGAWQSASIDSVLVQRCPERAKNATLLLRAEATGDTMLVSIAALAAWLQSFYQQFTLGSNETADPPPGTCAVLDVLPPQRVRIVKDSE